MEKLGTVSQISAAVSAMLSMVSFGFHAGWPSPTLVKLLAEDSDIPITSSQGAWIVGFMALGWMFASVFIPILTDTWGRRKIMLLLSIPCLAGNITIIFATTYWLLCLARFLVGISIGVTLIGGLMYTSEISEDRLRGVLGSLLNNMNNIGLLIAYCVGPRVSRATLAMVGAAIPAIFVLIFFWMPESPYFLVMKKKDDEARKSLMWLRGREDVTEDLKTIAQNVEFDQKNVGSYKELLMTPANRRALVITNGLMFAQEFSGIAAINAYSSLIFEASGAKLSTDTSLIIVALIQLLSGAFSAYVITLAGRRKLLFISVTGTVFFLSCEALYFQLQNAGVDVESIFWLPLVGIVGFVICYTLGLGILPGSMNPEVYPCNLRAKGLMVTNIVTLVYMTIVTQIYQIIADAIGIQFAFWSFAGITVCSGIFIYFFVPETHNRSMSDIHSHLRHITRSKSIRRASKENSEMPVSPDPQTPASIDSTRAGLIDSRHRLKKNVLPSENLPSTLPSKGNFNKEADEKR